MRSHPLARIIAVVATGLSPFLLQSCFMTSQDPGEIFADGRLPEALQALANPPARVSNDDIAARGDGLRVAVIDNGVDYLHEALKDRIDYATADGAVSGAGVDILGNDSWAYPNLIDARLFAFGAEITADGKIQNPLADPIARIGELNGQYMDLFEAEMRTRAEQFRGTFFERFDRTNFHLLGAYSIIQSKPEYLESHRQTRDMNLLVDPTSRETATGALREFLDDMQPGDLRAIFVSPWRMGSGSGLPAQVSSLGLSSLKGMDAFFEVITSTLASFESATQFSDRYFQPYFDYRFNDLSPSERADRRENLVSSFAGDLFRPWFRVHTHYRGNDPLYSTVRHFCSTLTDEELARLTSAATPAEEKERFVLGRIGEIFELARTVNQMIVDAPHVEASSRRTARKHLEKDPRFSEWFTNVLRDRGIENFYCNSEALENGTHRYADVYRDRGRRVSHPYLDGSSSGISHGSHVSGIILAQEATARISPVRVITSSRSDNDAIERETQERFLREFEEWLGVPIVNGAVAKAAAELIDFSGIPADAVDRDARRTALVMAKVREQMPVAFENNPLDFYFFNQVKDAIKWVGEHRIKLANVSLGAEFEKRTTRIATDDEVEFDDLFEFLMFEFFKYTVSQTINRHAENTLFVIAAGNSGAWLDGRSRSGLPCDLSSPFLERELDGSSHEPLPNQRVNNILCVGSIDEDRDLSAFSNILLTQVPFVVSLGEAIPSAVRSDDCEGVDQAVERHMGEVPSIDTMTLGETKLEELLVAQGRLAADADDELRMKIRRREATRIMNLDGVLQTLFSVSRTHECVAGNYLAHARMSGTSMASPAVAGRMARLVAEKMRAAGLRDGDIYDNAAFAPHMLISELMEASPRFGGSSIVQELRTIVDIRPYTSTRTDEDLIRVRRVELGGGGETVIVEHPAQQVP